MKIHFQLDYRAKEGETLHVILYRFGAGANEQKINIPLRLQEGTCWQGEIQLLLKRPLKLRYHYEVRHQTKVVRREWQTVGRYLQVDPKIEDYFLKDNWRDLPRDSWAYTSAFTRVWQAREEQTFSALPVFARTCVLRVQSARPLADEKLWICGTGDALGNWDPMHAKPLLEIAPNEWAVALNADELSFPVEYKFLVRKDQSSSENQPTVCWEQGPNRICESVNVEKQQMYIRSDLKPVFSGEGNWRVAGTEIPVFSLRSSTGWGCGDFGDIAHLVDWAAQTGQRALQFLPVNDTTFTRSWRDSSPYQILSSHALHPIYADVRAFPALPREEAESFEQIRQVLNEQSQLNYEGVLQLKLKRLKRAFEQEGAETLASSDFRAFFQENEYWLPGYAMFCVLRDRFNTVDYSRWPQHMFFAQEDVRHFCSLGAPAEQEIRFWYYVQFILHTQLLTAAQYARSRGVVLIGDVPLGMPLHSVDAWMHPELFNLNEQMGVPPDDFSATGQNWGFPPYNWEAFEKDGYRWWYRRMNHLAKYFDAYRLDHMQGFFRIWQIPRTATQGLLGQFSPAQGFTAKEMESRGFHFVSSYVKPYISKEVLDDIFGVLAQHITENFLRSDGKNGLEFRPEYDSQRKIEDALSDGSPETALIRRGLCELMGNVLFVKDTEKKGVFHPRINAQYTHVFLSLPSEQQLAFTKLCEDYFSARQNNLWKQEALKRFPPVVQATSMLCCGEDLGLLPSCLPEIAQKLAILRLEIQRMPKTDDREFGDTAQYPYLSVAMPSTHDMPVLRSWWQERPQRIQHYWNHVLGKAGDYPSQANYEVCEAIVQKHLESPSMITLMLLQDWTSMDPLLRGVDPELERINDPANPRYHWRYRMPIALEDLLEQTSFNEKIKKLISQSGRNI